MMSTCKGKALPSDSLPVTDLPEGMSPTAKTWPKLTGTSDWLPLPVFCTWNAVTVPGITSIVVVLVELVVVVVAVEAVDEVGPLDAVVLFVTEPPPDN